MSRTRLSLLFAAWLAASVLPAHAAMDYGLETKLSASISNAEGLYQAGQWDKVLTLARQIMKDAPADHPAKQRAYDLVLLATEKQAQERLGEQQRVTEQKNRQTSEQLVAEGSKLMSEKKFAEALDKFKSAVRSFGGDAETWYLLGYAFQRTDKPYDAYGAYKQCIKLNGKHPRALFHLAELAFKSKKNSEAEEFSRRLITEIENQLDQLNSLFYEQRAANLNDKAIATARKIGAAKRNLAQASYMLGLLTETRGALQDAKTALERTVRLDPTSMDGYYHLGKVYLRLEIFHQSTVAFEQAILIGENTLKEDRARAKKLLDDGKPDAAVEAELRTKMMAGRLALCQYGLAVANHRRSDPTTAMEAIDKALELKPDFLQARFARAIFLAAKREYQSALYEMRQVLQKAAPNSPEAKRAVQTLKLLMDQSMATTQPHLVAARKEAVRSVEVDAQVKHQPGIGGRAAEKEWESLFPVMAEIQSLIDKRNVPEAVRRLIHLRFEHPNIAEVHAVLGFCYMEQNRWTDAEDSFKKALAINPNEAQSLSNLAYINALRGTQLDKALEMAKKAVGLDDGRAAFHHTLGWVLFKQGEVDKAIAELNRAVELDPNYTLARYNLGLAQYLAGTFEMALVSFDGVLLKNPGHVKAALFKALTLAKLKKTAESLALLEKLQKTLPEKETLGKVVATLHDRLKLAEERNTDLPIPEMKSHAPIAKLLAQARTYRSKGLVNHAKELYLECQRLAPREFASWYEMGDMYANAGLSRPALNAWEKALELNPNSYELQFKMGRMQYRLQKRDKARQAFVNAQSLRPEDPEPHYYLGLMAFEEKRFESAESSSLAALRLKPRFYKAMALLGMARIHLGRYLPARDAYEMLYAKAPADSAIRRHARKKLWELSRLLAPEKGPSYANVKQVQEQIQRRVEGGTNSQSVSPKAAGKPVPEYGHTMTTDEKLWVLKRLEQFPVIARQAPYSYGPGTTGSTLSNDEKLWVLKRLEGLKSVKEQYAPPPPSVTSKYKLHEAPKPQRPEDPSDADTLAGLESAEKGFMSEALERFEKARSLSPKNLDVLMNLGFLHTLLGNFKNAFEAFSQAALHHPKHPAPKLALGNLYWLGGKGPEAVAQWKGMIGKVAFDPKFSFIRRSEKAWKRVLDTNPTDPDAHSNLGIVYLFSQRLTDAIAEFQGVLAVAPARQEHVFYKAMAWTILYCGNNKTATKKEAKGALVELETQAPPFPHSRSLRQYLETL
ncbi:MAG TPA: tetratricopeptide repeat protein [Candidatus Ozemobacteraceae bacterium]|nr:tetratricopeptide repeat protein [Candidatus Ozemobacteraceae bacterium]